MTFIPLKSMKRNGKFDVWDLGPQVSPKAPPAPEGPDARLKGAELAAAELEYEDACETYKDKLRAYTAARKAHRAWTDEKGGPIKLEMWGADLRHALAIEPDRFKMELPKGMKPGHAQIEAEKMEAAEAEEIERSRSRDPMHMNTIGASP